MKQLATWLPRAVQWQLFLRLRELGWTADEIFDRTGIRPSQAPLRMLR